VSKDYQLVLASGSPRRRDLLNSVGLDFIVHVTNTDESRKLDEAPLAFVKRLAQDKALAAQSSLSGDSTAYAILAADTIVVKDQMVFGKPKDYDDAVRIWALLSEQKHQVITGVCILLSNSGVHDKMQCITSVTHVEFGEIKSSQMQRYWQTGEPADKAGAYAIQGYASAWVKRISGSYSNVVGLPLREVNDLLKIVNKNWL